MSLKIVSLAAENYKRLKTVELRPDGDVVVIGGKNASGKSSILDAIWSALTGREAASLTQRPIRAGEDHAVVTLDLGDYIVERRWTQDDAGTLTVKAPDGAKYSSPQKLLDEIMSKRSFDPLKFIRQDAKAQVATLLEILGDSLPFDPDELDRERAGVFDRRTEVGRDVKKLEGQLGGYPPPDRSLPGEEVSLSDLVAEREAARAKNDAYQQAVAYDKRLMARFTELQAEIDKVQRELQQSEQRVRDLDEPTDLSAFDERIARHEQTNARIRKQQERQAVQAELSDRKGEVAQFTLAIQEIDKQKAHGLAQANLPVPGLSFDDSGVTLNGIPFSQASTAEQLRVSTALSMSFNPRLRVLRIDNGEALDSDSMQIIRDLAADHDYQVWTTKVSEDASIEFIVDDGELTGGVA